MINFEGYNVPNMTLTEARLEKFIEAACEIVGDQCGNACDTCILKVDDEAAKAAFKKYIIFGGFFKSGGK